MFSLTLHLCFINNIFCFARESSCQIEQSWWQKSCFVLVKRLASLQVWSWPIFFHNTQVHSLSRRKLSITAIKGLCVIPVVLCCKRKKSVRPSIQPSNHLFFFFLLFPPHTGGTRGAFRPAGICHPSLQQLLAYPLVFTHTDLSRSSLGGQGRSSSSTLSSTE